MFVQLIPDLQTIICKETGVYLVPSLNCTLEMIRLMFKKNLKSQIPKTCFSHSKTYSKISIFLVGRNKYWIIYVRWTKLSLVAAEIVIHISLLIRSTAFFHFISVEKTVRSHWPGLQAQSTFRKQIRFFTPS